MKVIKEKTYKVSEVVPETEKERKEIEKMIEDAKEEDKNFNPSEWKLGSVINFV